MDLELTGRVAIVTGASRGVGNVHPGLTRTERTDEETDRRARGNAIRRIVDAREIGLVVAFLASTKAAAITGVAIDASGGSIPVMFQ